MKLIKTKECGLKENYLELHYDNIDEETSAVITQIDLSFSHIGGICGGERVTVLAGDVFYFESVDRKTFAYTEKMTIELRKTLRELLEDFAGIGFVRISRSVIVNVRKIDHLRGDLNMRVMIFLKNKEQLVMNRSYKKDFFRHSKSWRDEKI